MNERMPNVIEIKFKNAREAFIALKGCITDPPVLQIHFADHTPLFAQTDEILYWALEGEKLTQVAPATIEDSQRTKIKVACDNILKSIKKIEDLLHIKEYFDSDCKAVRKKLSEIRELAQKINF